MAISRMCLQLPPCVMLLLQCSDTVGLVIRPVKIVPEMTYFVLSGTLRYHTPMSAISLQRGGAITGSMLAQHPTLHYFRQVTSHGMAISRMCLQLASCVMLLFPVNMKVRVTAGSVRFFSLQQTSSSSTSVEA